MKKWVNPEHIFLGLLTIGLIFIGVGWTTLGTTIPTVMGSRPSPTATPIVTATPQPSPHSECQIRGVLPDPSCTPGAVDQRVTQETIQQTICRKGYTSTVRPSVSYTNKLKQEQIQRYGYQDLNPQHYEEDHLISLELGGSPEDPRNLWPEPGSSPNAKDTIENLCHEKVCRGLISLAEAQRQIATDWTKACQ